MTWTRARASVYVPIIAALVCLACVLILETGVVPETGAALLLAVIFLTPIVNLSMLIVAIAAVMKPDTDVRYARLGVLLNILGLCASLILVTFIIIARLTAFS